MAKLDARSRARLPDSAFAYVDSGGRRRLPIHDEPHLRNALARFNQVAFESEAARERARKRLLNAAKRYGIVPVGFITRQLETERRHAATGLDPATLPTGRVTLLMSDIEASTTLLHRLEHRYRDLLRDVRAILRDAVSGSGGHPIDARADDFFAVFKAARSATVAAATIQRGLGEKKWQRDLEVRVRIGIHSGRPKLTDVGYIGVAVHTTARICSAAHGGQIVVSGRTREAVGKPLPAGIRFRSLGRHRLRGLEETHTLFQVHADGLPRKFPPLRVSAPFADPGEDPSESAT
ncbi:MAG: adenylate/guanylate cyclase domain-containing protein [Candidatus Limnocylindria bacterium]